MFHTVVVHELLMSYILNQGHISKVKIRIDTVKISAWALYTSDLDICIY